MSEKCPNSFLIAMALVGGTLVMALLLGHYGMVSILIGALGATIICCAADAAEKRMAEQQATQRQRTNIYVLTRPRPSRATVALYE